MNIDFVTPVWLWLFLALPGVAWWLRPNPATGLTMASAEPWRQTRSVLDLLERVPLIMRVASMGALLVALSGPQLIQVFEEPVVEDIGIAIAMDLSTSMWAGDMAARQSRLDVAKSTVVNFIDNRDDDIGLVSFAGEALTRLPLTHDGYVVREAVEAFEVGLLMDGTDVAGAIAAGAGLLKDAHHASKVLILVTDGAHNKAGMVPALAARAAAAVGVTIFPIAIGQEQGRDSESMQTVLTQAAQITGGQYFKATDVAGLEAIYTEIDRLVQPSDRVDKRIEATPIAWLFALLSLAMSTLATAMRGSRWAVIP
jgi:Ca-activated chloride channel family protein